MLELKVDPKKGRPLSEAHKAALRAAHPHLTGTASPHWKGGPPICIGCKKPVPNRQSKKTKTGLCKKCFGELRGPNHPAYKNGLGSNNTFWSRKRRVRAVDAEGLHTELEWQQLKEQYDYTCLGCRRKEPEIKLTRDHVVPLNKGGSDHIENIQPLCLSCNSKKHLQTTDFRIQYHA